jgi:hypothetical protein
MIVSTRSQENSGLNQGDEMNNEGETVQELRAPRAPTRSYMSPLDLSELRTKILKTTLAKLAQQLIRPDTGRPITTSALCRYANGTRPIPQWVAEQVILLAEAAKKYDARK